MANQRQQDFSAALKNLLDAYTELDISIFDDDEKEWDLGPQAEFKKQHKEAVKQMLVNGHYTTDEVAKVVNDLAETLEEIDPDVFQRS